MAPVLVIGVGIWQGQSLASAYAWGGGIFSGLVLTIYLLINVAAIAFFLRRKKHGESYNPLMHLVIPLIGIVISAWFLYQAFFANYLNSEAGFVAAQSIVVAWAVIFILGGISAAIFLARRKSSAQR